MLDEPEMCRIVIFVVVNTQSNEAHSMSHLVSAPITITIILSHKFLFASFSMHVPVLYKLIQMSLNFVFTVVVSHFIRFYPLAACAEICIYDLHIAYISCLFLHTFRKYLQLTWAFDGDGGGGGQPSYIRANETFSYDIHCSSENAIESHLEQLTSSRLTGDGRCIAYNTNEKRRSHTNQRAKISQFVFLIHKMRMVRL